MDPKPQSWTEVVQAHRCQADAPSRWACGTRLRQEALDGEESDAPVPPFLLPDAAAFWGAVAAEARTTGDACCSAERRHVRDTLGGRTALWLRSGGGTAAGLRAPPRRAQLCCVAWRADICRWQSASSWVGGSCWRCGHGGSATCERAPANAPRTSGSVKLRPDSCDR